MTLSRSYQDEIGSEREYELIVILKPDSTKENIQVLTKRLLEMVDKNSGKVLNIENWGRRNLAYEIAKSKKGIYLYFRLLGYYELIPEVERLLRMIEKVVRYQTILVDENVDPTARPDQVDEAMLDAISEIHTAVYNEETDENSEKNSDDDNDFEDEEEADFEEDEDKE